MRVAIVNHFATNSYPYKCQQAAKYEPKMDHICCGFYFFNITVTVTTQTTQHLFEERMAMQIKWFVEEIFLIKQ